MVEDLAVVGGWVVGCRVCSLAGGMAEVSSRRGIEVAGCTVVAHMVVAQTVGDSHSWVEDRHMLC